MYFRICEGDKSKGLHRFTDYVETTKGEKISTDERKKKSEELYLLFVNRVDMLNDGMYTVTLQSNKFASESAAPFTFPIGDPDTFPQKVGSVVSKAANTEGSLGLGMGAGSGMNAVLLMMMQMQAKSSQDMMAMQQANFQQQMTMMQQMAAKDMELHKVGSVKTREDKVFGLLQSPAFLNTLGKFAPQTVAIGRAVAPNGDKVSRPSETEQADYEANTETPTAPQGIAPTQQGDAKKLGDLLQKIQEMYPGENPVDKMAEGFDQIQAYMAFQNTTNP
ncbi:MAG: hypothetical protein U5L45_15880 [Saprospiraceae bacterium]|nr:hypothetical protein [Saprospiraceae bacterium]